MKFIMMNGAPGSGKDLVTKMLGAHINKHMANEVYHFKFADVLRAIAGIFTHLDLEDDLDYAQFKEEQVPVLNITGRQLMIDIAETFLKTNYGKDIMAKMTAESVTQYGTSDDIFIISDCGFVEEVEHFAKLFGEENIYVVNIKREGYDYAEDSRSDVNWLNTYELVNAGDLTALDTEVGRLYGRLRNQYKFM